MVSEHFHPWTPQQGQSAFAWSFMGALGTRTSLPFGTAVTCPGFRYHPAVIAHAAATLGAMYPGRFYLGLGAGEALNEHVVGGVWPEIGIRSAMMFESIEIINKLFTRQGRQAQGRVLHARERPAVHHRPEEQRVPVYVATAGPVNAKKTGKFADGMITVGAADEKIGMLWDKFEEGASEAGKDVTIVAEAAPDPRLLGADRRGGDRERVSASGRTAACPSPSRTSRTPRTSRRWRRWSRPEDFKNRVLMTSDLEAHTKHIQHYVDMGFDEVHLHNVGRNQAEFIETFGREVLPNLKLG